MKQIQLKLSFKARLELYLLHIKIGDPFKSRLRLAVEGLPDLFKNKSYGALFG